MSIVKVKDGQSLAAGRKRAQAMANRTGRSVEVHRQEIDREAPGGRVRYVWVFDDVMYPQKSNPRRNNPTKAQKREKARKAGVQRRVAVALAKYLKQQNPSAKLAGARVEKLKGGVLKITPIKANRGGRK